MVKSDKVFNRLSLEANEYFQNHSEVRNYKRSEAIYKMGERPRGLYVLKKGLVGLIHYSEKGTDHLLRLFRSSQFFGHRSYFANEPHHATALALKDCNVQFIPRESLEELLRIDPTFYQCAVEAMAKELRAAEIHRVLVSDNEVLARTAHAIVVLKEIDSKHNWTRAEIASFCASTTPTIVRALADLEGRGLIRQKGREIEIVDRDALLRLN